jgi:hypothetical protein
MMALLAALEQSAFSIWLRESTSIWAYPTVLMLHTVGLAMLVGLNAAVDLRVLGFGRGIELAWFRKLFPAMWIGFWMNLVTGAMLFAIDPIVKGTTTLFMFKLGLVVVGVVLIVVLRRTMYGGAPRAVPVTPATKAIALLSLIVWLAAITTGRFMAYI